MCVVKVVSESVNGFFLDNCHGVIYVSAPEPGGICEGWQCFMFTPKYATKLINTLKKFKDAGKITYPQYRHLYPPSHTTPKFYSLPKIHKASVPLRPIVASRGSITYNSARLLADILGPLVGRTPQFLKNSTELVNELSKFNIAPDESLVSYDVTALFTSVPVQESLRVVKNLLDNDISLPNRT